MCGIAGYLDLGGGSPPTEALLRAMLAQIRHRGPDQFGIFRDGPVALGSARLSIIDLSTGRQPITNEDGSLWIVYNGEVFNYVELRRELEARGHRFSTHTDTEVILHLYEELGPDCLSRLNGQFAIAIWDTRKKTLFLARDRLGVRPLFYATGQGRLCFGSEIKALLADPRTKAEIDPLSLTQVFSFWSPLSSRTVFRGISELPPGHYALVRGGDLAIKRYWSVDFSDPAEARRTNRPLESYVDEFRELLIDATRVRLRADVPVGAYLSGGLDSSVITSIIRTCTSTPLDTFSIAFDDVDFDESKYQQEMARHLGTKHQVVHATHADIGRVFPDVIWHTEAPLMRTSPAPMFMLSRLVRDSGYKVVLTGEGADEFLGGYDIFKEAKIRRFWAQEPTSTRRPLLFQRLYRDIPGFASGNNAFLPAFFKDGLTDTASPWYSHFIRWKNNRRNLRFLSGAVADEAAARAPAFFEQIEIPARFSQWGPLERAQYLEINVFFSQYLLSSQGDRVAMAHSVEGRFPFLDFRVVEFCSRLPSSLKLRGLNEKFLLRQSAKRWLPEAILNRPKRPYRAPIRKSFFNAATKDYVEDLCSSAMLLESGLFKPAPVSQLFERARQGAPMGETDDMALAGILSTQLVYSRFVKNFRGAPPLGDKDDVLVCGPQPQPTTT